MIPPSSFAHSPRNLAIAFAGMACGVFLHLGVATDLSAQDGKLPFHGALLSAKDATVNRLGELKADGVTAIAIPIHNDESSRVAEREACRRVLDMELTLCFWIEVARCPELADAHPEWMASLQGHPEWRRFFKETPLPREGEVVKTYPWVPILNQEPFDGQLARLRTLLKRRPTPGFIFLNDLQGAPSACGCGHHLCRWISDYGERRTTTPLGNRAPADFVAAVKQLAPRSAIVPVWTTECEEHDGAKDGLCAGVRCFQGKCWKAWTEQLTATATQSRTIGVLLPYKAFNRNLPIYGPEAGWIDHALRSFQTMPARYRTAPIPASRLLAVLQGWDATDREIAVQKDVAKAAGVESVLVAYDKIEQDWRPRVTKLR